jgi:nucleotide-binding universal stress UspA family protein
LDKTIIKNLLVPLDGSPLAESVLPVVSRLAKKMKVSVTLIHIIEAGAPETIHGQRHLTTPIQAEEYLKSLASSDVFKGINVDVHVHDVSVKDVSLSISDHSKELNQDLVIMCTHGNGGLHDFLFGSIAQQVTALGDTPVLLINPSQENLDTSAKFENFLIPLDGNPDHEHALEYSSVLAKMCNAKIHLLMAIPHFGTMSGELTPANRLLPGTTSKMLDMIVSDAKEYLQTLQVQLEATGLQVSVSASRNDPAKAITETAKKVNADLIILGTHGKKGAEAFWDGSVSPKISKSSKIPLLLVHVKE